MKKAIKIIIWLVVGFILGLFFMPITYYIEERTSKIISSVSSCDTAPKEFLMPLVKQGDTLAYHNLQIYFGCSQNAEAREELLPYALLMANKYHYKAAYFDIYNCFIGIYANGAYNLDLDSLDIITRNIALEYLQKGAELGDNNCQHYLKKYYSARKYFDKNGARRE